MLQIPLLLGSSLAQRCLYFQICHQPNLQHLPLQIHSILFALLQYRSSLLVFFVYCHSVPLLSSNLLSIRTIWSLFQRCQLLVQSAEVLTNSLRLGSICFLLVWFHLQASYWSLPIWSLSCWIFWLPPFSLFHTALFQLLLLPLIKSPLVSCSLLSLLFLA